MTDSLAQIQEDFLAYLKQDEKTSGLMTTHVKPQGDLSVDTRLAIYRNAYQIRLKQTLETDHPMLGLYLGDELFEQMFVGYLAKHPSKQPSLRHYAEQLPAFLANTLPFNQHPILAELASFERCLLVAFDAFDRPRATSQELAQIAAENWPLIQLRFHPSVQLYTEHWNSVASWQALKAEQAPPEAAKHVSPNTWLVWRNREMLTEFYSLAEDEGYMLSAYLSGANFAEVCEGLLNFYSPEKVPVQAVKWLQHWLALGIVSQIELSG